LSRVAIVTLGCPKNAVDSEGLGGLLDACGHEVGTDVGDADVVVVNTCGFIDAARRETIDEVLDLGELKRRGEVKGLVLAGCLVARSAPELADALPEVDALVDFAAYPRIGEIVSEVEAGHSAQVVHGDPGTRFDPAWWDAAMARSARLRFGRPPWAYLKIAEGCDRRCTFCAIPLMRGRLRSRSSAHIETEARHLVAQGVSELSLVSQDSVMWGRDTQEATLVDLLRRLDRIDGLQRVRLMYLHPQGVSDELIDVMLETPSVVPYFDLSLQHVAPRVLQAMGRWGSAARFERIIGRVRDADPLAALRATFILGFPGETDGDAAAVEAFVRAGELDWVGTFTYSREQGTRSHDLPGQVPEVIARERAERVSSAAEEAMDRRAASFVGTRRRVLVERFLPDEKLWTGRSEREAPEVDGEIHVLAQTPLRVGDYVDVCITGSEGAYLTGRQVVAAATASPPL
jgi:ribosomal protein S12 methylthiotransferase